MPKLSKKLPPIEETKCHGLGSKATILSKPDPKPSDQMIKKCLSCIYLSTKGCCFQAIVSTMTPACNYEGTFIGLITGTTTLEKLLHWQSASIKAAEIAKERGFKTRNILGVEYYIPEEAKQ